MPFDLCVPGTKPIDVGRVERKEFQARFLPGDSGRV
jgi:hypothetical protein